MEHLFTISEQEVERENANGLSLLGYFYEKKIGVERNYS